MPTRIQPADGTLPTVALHAAETELERALRRVVRGEVRFDRGSRGMYATDASSYRQVPIGVVVPRDDNDVRHAVRLAREHGAPVLPRGAGTSLAGQCCNVAVVLDFSKYMGRVLEVNVEDRWARVQPGTVLDDLQDRVRPYGLTFGPDPATHDRCTLGGMIGNNSCGVHSVLAQHYGPGPRTEHQVLELRVLTYDGEELTVGAIGPEALQRVIAAGGRRGQIYRDLRDIGKRYQHQIRERFPDIPRRVSGYNLPALLPGGDLDIAKALVGAEGTAAIILEAKVRLIENPPETALLVLGYEDIYHAADHVVEIQRHRPTGLEGIDDGLVDYMNLKGLHTKELMELMPGGRGWLFVEFGGETRADAEATARVALADLESTTTHLVDHRLYGDAEGQQAVWEVRESGLGATAHVPGMPPSWEGWEDAAVAPEHIGDYLREFRVLLDRYGYSAALYGHYGQGCVHCRITFDFSTPEGLASFRSFIDEAADLVLRYGGSISGEHGDGQARGALLPKMFGADLMEAFREFKRVWDPDWKMNPGKLVDALPPDENLYFGPDYDPPDTPTHFRYPNDNFGFENALARCVGFGKCRRREGGVMCPSYMVTAEEAHSTRGRARLLHEMMRGEAVPDGWRSEEVKEALDLCLSCKGCKGECPVDVDMATYKAEFLSHYYEGRLRPRVSYAMGLIDEWAPLVRLAPSLVNWATHAPGLSALIKRAGGIAPEREIPRFADRTFRDWFRERGPSRVDGPRVLVWPDTFNDHFHPEIGRATVEVLEAAGFRPDLPPPGLATGRPLYDHGMLGLARRRLARVLDALADEIRAGTPVIGMEPSAVSVFRDELTNLFPHDPAAQRLAEQSFMLTEFLTERAGETDLGSLRGERALVHGHCHHRSVLDFDTETAVLDRLEIDYEVLDSGCCGMAGAFGFEDEKYDVAQAAAERVLLPAIRAADPRTLVITDGFSCREMIVQNGLPRPLHTAEIIHMALQRAGRLETPEDPVPAPAAGTGSALRLAAGAALGIVAYRFTRRLLRRD